MPWKETSTVDLRRCFIRDYLRRSLSIADLCRDQDIDLIVGGEGLWPDVVEYGYRCRSFRDLEKVLGSLGYID